MRIQQLDLLRYGHFTDAAIPMPSTVPDLLVVEGGNEAGKSTAMAGIEDTFFGIAANSPFNFLHEYAAMRVGATLAKGGDTITVRRRKGNKDTLLSEHDLPIPAGEGALVPYLAGADRHFYTRMFSLDHDRLRQGGQEILQAQDDVGQILFSASAGIMGLRESLKSMQEEADALWASRRAAHRRYFQAEERLKSADAAMREHLVTTGKWQLLKSAFETADQAYQAIEKEIELKSAELRKLNRIRRVCRDVRKRSETEVAIEALGTVIPFAADALDLLEKAARDDADAASRIATLNEQIAGVRTERTALVYDEPLLARAEDIQGLHDRRIQIRAGKADLPKRRAELAGAVATLNRLAAELEWTGDIDALMARIPARAKIATLRTLLNRHGEQAAAVENAKASLSEADDTLAGLAAQIEALGTAKDVSKLAAAINATRATGDIAGQIANCGRDEKEARAAIDRGLKALRPAVSDHETLQSMPVPPLASVETHRDACRNLEQRARTCGERKRAAEQERLRHRKAYDRLAADEHVIVPDELQRLRAHRDIGWSLIRRRHVDRIAVSDEEVRVFCPADELPGAFEASMCAADTAADRRFEKSAAAAQLAVIARQIAEQTDLLDALAAEERSLAQERAELDAAWTALWAGTGLPAQDPDAMVQWLRERSNILNSAAQLSAAQGQTATWRGREAEARRLLAAELGALGISPESLAGQPLHATIELATAVERTHEGTAKTRRDFETAQRKATSDAARKRKALEKAEGERTDWTAQWRAALEALRLPATSSPETADAQINAIDEMREAAVRINDLRHERIEKIERDIRTFEHDVAALVQAIAPQLVGADAEDAVLDLQRLLAEVTLVRDRAAAKDVALGGLQKKIDECRESCRDAREVISRLREAAGVETIDALRTAIRQSDAMRKLTGELDQLTRALAEDGDGLSIAALGEECVTCDPDEIAAREQTVTNEITDLRARLMEAGENRSNARRAFDAIGGDDRAARDAADRQAALAEIKEIADQYIRLRSAIVVLQWAIDRYRREKQAPMLKRAGELFALLTGGSFQTLQLEFDEQDNAELAGIRPDGRRVTVAGMSDGTTDQLYLALRIAAVEDYLDHAEPMPFIADDLFINFDDRRAAAGFRVLNELAKKTQVLFFTHHEHLLEVARTALGASVPAVMLPVVAGRVELGPVHSQAA